MSNLSTRSAVFVGCARNCDAYLEQVLCNVERIAALYAKAAFVFVENDSEDGSKATLLKWVGLHPTGTLLELDGLATAEPKRTARLARARNAYLDCVIAGPFSDHDDLVVLDFDDVNAASLDLDAFAAAEEFLHIDDQTAGIFASSRPVYFDIWALRHPTWCPNDCWAEVRAQPGPRPTAVERLVYKRQISIDPGQAPIAVASAFGGLGIYRLAKVLPHRYVGTTPVGEEVCEHVSLNLGLSRSSRLFIFPALQTMAPPQHLRPQRELTLEQSGKRCVLRAPPEHRLDAYRAANPLYDRRLPLLSKLVGAASPAGVIIDVGANIGDTVALCRMAGCEAPIIAIEPSEKYFAFLEANRQALPDLFYNVRTLQAFIGAGTEPLSLAEGAGTGRVEIIRDRSIGGAPGYLPTVPLSRVTDQKVSLIKCDTDGYDATILAASIEFLRSSIPVIWAEAEATDPSDEERWCELCSNLSESHPNMCIFDNFGFLVANGAVPEKQTTFLDLLRYTRRQRASDAKTKRRPTMYYVDVAFFPKAAFAIYSAFISELTESAL